MDPEPGWQRTRVILSERDGWWTARLPCVPGCTGHGRSRAEALEGLARLRRAASNTGAA